MAQTIGEQLREARLQRKLTLEQASQATHIRKHYLEALENDQRDALPSTVQGRGFLRLYSGLLELSTPDLLAAWDGKAPQPSAVDQVSAVENTSPASSSPTDDLSSASSDNAQSPAPSPLRREAQPDIQTEKNAENEAGEASSQAIFKTIGQKLLAQRETLGLSFAEVERYTRLRAHYIQAIEDGRIEELPSPVQYRGMLSNYAAFLNLDEDAIMLNFAEGLQARRVERIPKPDPPGVFAQRKRLARKAPFWKRFLTPDMIFGVGAAIIILFFALWTASRINALRVSEDQPTPPAISDVLLNPAARTSSPEAGTPGAATPGAALAGDAGLNPETPVPEEQAAESPPDPNADPAETLPSIEASTPGVVIISLSETPAGTPTLPPMNSDPLQVYIVARQRAWLRVVADGKVKFLGRTVPGNAYAFSGSKQIEISTGNAAALQVFYNQIDMGTLGLSGEVANLVFSPEGYATPTAAFTATASPTPIATLTPLPSPTPPATPTITPFVP